MVPLQLQNTRTNARTHVQGYLTHKKHPSSLEPPYALAIVLPQGPRRASFLMSGVALRACVGVCVLQLKRYHPMDPGSRCQRKPRITLRIRRALIPIIHNTPLAASRSFQFSSRASTLLGITPCEVTPVILHEVTLVILQGVVSPERSPSDLRLKRKCARERQQVTSPWSA